MSRALASLRRVVRFGALGLLLGGCGVKRVPAAMLEQLPYESRIELLEAENVLAVAIDRVDEARAEVQRLRRSMNRADALLSSASAERSTASDPALREIAELSVAEAEARRDFLDAKRRFEARHLRVEELGLSCAGMRFEEARLALVRGVKVPGSEALSPEKFRAQTVDCEDDEKSARAALAEARVPVEAALAEWESSRQRLSQKTDGGRASVYVE